MPPVPHWSKSSLATFIHKNKKLHSRYELDLSLLEAGHSPEEIEAAWQLANPAPARPISIKIQFIDLLILVSGLLFAVFSFFNPGFWPFVLFNPLIYLLISVVSLAATIALFMWGKARKKVNLKDSWVHSCAK